MVVLIQPRLRPLVCVIASYEFSIARENNVDANHFFAVLFAVIFVLLNIYTNLMTKRGILKVLTFYMIILGIVALAVMVIGMTLNLFCI
jgi:hypothetical protein